MTVEEMKQRKKEFGYSNEKLSELSGVPLGTVQKVLAGVTRSPRYETLIALERVLKKQTDRIGEALPEMSEKRQGAYTVEDYYLIPKERRVELIDGVIYDMASPTAIHQILSTELCNIIRSYISQQKVNYNCSYNSMIFSFVARSSENALALPVAIPIFKASS